MNVSWAGQSQVADARRVALVTGASRRIGLRIAQRLVAANYAAILHTSRASEGETMRAATEMADKGGVVGIVTADLSDAMESAALVPSVVGAAGRLDLLVNSASVFVDDNPFEPDASIWDRHFAVNLRAPMVLAAAFAATPPTEDDDRSIVNILDQRVLRLTPQFFSYTLSKSALWTATRTLAQAFAAKKIRVNAIGPGPVLPNESQGEAGFAREVAGVPLARAVAPDDIADAVLYLASARTVTGQMIAVDSGQHLGWQTPDVLA